jgi:hypothetical protein
MASQVGSSLYLRVDKGVKDGRGEEDAGKGAVVVVLWRQVDPEAEDAVAVHRAPHKDGAIPRPQVLRRRKHVHTCPTRQTPRGVA